MTTNYTYIKKLKNMHFKGLYSERLLVYKTHKGEFQMHLSTSLLGFRPKEENAAEKFWHMKWNELLPSGHDVLLIREQNTPEPLQYEEINSPYQTYVVSASNYSTAFNTINNAWAYGYPEEEDIQLHTVILELEESFMNISATPGGVTITLTEEFPAPSEYDVILASTENRKELNRDEGS
ncbi:hypothetical protein [Jeotgalibacillus salarius]|uniref:Uncharacterized protein n=1 Tax=Jeotgalibacillus salarius TaxID=546023 RepID=A0A4Y8LFC0_9BACL|nr:hypothetical protein [Jeotgalibacillus salarius]TFE01528.1 hypothetical protein E2626_08115 [Jeotgalibacillus salarius]